MRVGKIVSVLDQSRTKRTGMLMLVAVDPKIGAGNCFAKEKLTAKKRHKRGPTSKNAVAQCTGVTPGPSETTLRGYGELAVQFILTLAMLLSVYRFLFFRTHLGRPDLGQNRSSSAYLWSGCVNTDATYASR